jgi:hypothetical protein
MLLHRIGLFSGLAIALVGCSRSSSQASVKGIITCKGEPVPAGEVYFVFEQGGRYGAALRSDGSYQFIDVPTGAVKVLVLARTLNSRQQGPPRAPKGKQYDGEMRKRLREYDGPAGKGEPPGGKSIEIPKKYASEKTSPLTFTVERGSQTRNFDLTD